MGEEKDNKKPQGDEAQMQQAEEQQTPPPTPNRDAYKAAFSEDYPDVDFEDKEARYGKMVEDRKRYNSYRKSGEKLNETFNNNRWLAAMIQDISESDDPDYSPIDWMADHGIDINEAMEDEETRKKVAEKIAKFQEDQLRGEEEDAQRQENFATSAENLRKLGLDDDTATQMWADFYTNIVDPALRGEVSEDTWRMLQKGMNYDADIESAKEQSAMQARNEKITNGVKKFDNPMPPSLSQGGDGQQARQKPKKESFFADLKDAGY